MGVKDCLFLFFVLMGYHEAIGQAAQRLEQLAPTEFFGKIARTDSAIVIDVRTPTEYAEGHLAGAANINWNGEFFDEHAALLDKSVPVFVYCRSGGRSGSASDRLKELGFEQVFDMQGGMMAWREAKLPETSPEVRVDEGMSMEDYRTLLHSNGVVLVDFYAEWCVPCIKMKPYLERIGQDMGDRVAVLRINIDQNRQLSEELGIAALPVLMLYANQERIWVHEGYLDEESIRKQLR